MPNPESAQTHPFDPLAPSEVESAIAVVREARQTASRIRFVSASPFESGLADESRRLVEVVLHEPEERRTVQLLIDIEDGKVEAEETFAESEPPIAVDEVVRCEAVLRADPEFLAALERRGIEDPMLVDVEPAPMGHYGLDDEEPGRRMARILAYARPTDPESNAFAYPLEGIHGIFDLSRGEVITLEDRGVVPKPPDPGEYRADRIRLREPLPPLEISQPEGPAFSVEGHHVRWQNWSLHVGFTSREGLVLHDIGYEDGDRGIRPILHRASIAEMVVPYADPGRFFQSPLDIGELNVGTLTNSLTLGCDCLGSIHYFDAAFIDAAGETVRVPQAICLHEEDDGILWKHTDYRTDVVDVRRGRRLVISNIVTVGNYEYGFYWYFHQDGVIACEIKATGIVATQAVADNEPTAYGKLVAPNLNAIHHQHIFCARLDFNLDGGGNSVTETRTITAPPGPDNPHGNGWTTESRTFASESEAQRLLDFSEMRSWTVVNPNQRNAVGQPVGYRILPGENTVPFSAPDSSVRRRAAFIDRHLWVTPRDADERYPAGEFPYQHQGGDGLPRWTAADRPIENTDLVVWYTLNHHHVPRPEDWPVMPVARLGFGLKPWGFFDRSPALDVPPSSKGDGKSCHA